MRNQARIFRALDLLQEAQRLTEQAGQQLCPVPRSADVWTETTDLYFEIKRQWHRVHQWYQTQHRQNGSA